MNCECGTPLGKKNKTGRCRSCGVRHAIANNPADLERRRAQMRKLSADPAIVEKRAALCRQTMADPAQRAKQGAAISRSWTERFAADPDARSRLQQWGRESGYRGGHAHKPETIDRMTAAKLTWCPREYWSLNRKLRDNGYRLPERKAMIQAEIDRSSPQAVARRAIAQFDAQQRARHEKDLAQR